MRVPQGVLPLTDCCQDRSRCWDTQIPEEASRREESLLLRPFGRGCRLSRFATSRVRAAGCIAGVVSDPLPPIRQLLPTNTARDLGARTPRRCRFGGVPCPKTRRMDTPRCRLDLGSSTHMQLSTESSSCTASPRTEALPSHTVVSTSLRSHHLAGRTASRTGWHTLQLSAVRSCGAKLRLLETMKREWLEQ